MSEKKLFDVEGDKKETVKEVKTKAPAKIVEKKTSCIVQRRNVIITPEFKAKIEAIRKNKKAK